MTPERKIRVLIGKAGLSPEGGWRPPSGPPPKVAWAKPTLGTAS